MAAELYERNISHCCAKAYVVYHYNYVHVYQCIALSCTAREDMRLKESHFDSKVPDVGAQKVCVCGIFVGYNYTYIRHLLVMLVITFSSHSSTLVLPALRKV